MMPPGPPPPPPQAAAVEAAPPPPPPPPPVEGVPGYVDAYNYQVVDSGRSSRRKPNPPSIISVVVLVVSIVLGLVVGIAIPVEEEAKLLVATVMGVIGFVGFAWMQDVSVGRRIAATVLAVLSVAWFIAPITLVLGIGFITAAWILVRRRTLVPLAVTPFAVVAAFAASIYFSYRANSAGVIFAFIPILLTAAVFAWVAVGIDSLIKTSAAQAEYRSTPALVHLGYSATGEPMYGYAAPVSYGYATAAQSTSIVATLSLIFGLFGSGIIAVILGHVAHSQIRRTGERGYGMATAGLVLGYLAVVVYVGLGIAYGVAVENYYFV